MRQWTNRLSRSPASKMFFLSLSWNKDACVQAARATCWQNKKAEWMCWFGDLLPLFDRHVFWRPKSRGSGVMLPLRRWCSILRSGDIRGITASLSVCADATRWWWWWWHRWGARSITLHPQPLIALCAAFLLLSLCHGHIVIIGFGQSLRCRVHDGKRRRWSRGDSLSFVILQGADIALLTQHVHAQQHSCAVLRTEPFVLYSSLAAFLFPCVAIPCLLWWGSRTVNPTVTQSAFMPLHPTCFISPAYVTVISDRSDICFSASGFIIFLVHQ